MSLKFHWTIVVCGACALGACGDAEAPEVADIGAPPLSSAETPVARPSSPETAGGGSAEVSLTGEGLSVSGTFSTRLCGGPYLLGDGVSYQADADDWQITVASERRESGDVPLNTPAGEVNVIVTANGPGLQFVRGPSNDGSLVIREDFRHAAADLELRSIVGGQTARLVATFTCDPPG